MNVGVREVGDDEVQEVPDVVMSVVDEELLDNIKDVVEVEA
jgi:hypothetical protein